jgi:hypothetical protein
MIETAIIIAAPLGIGENMIGLHDLAKKTERSVPTRSG